MHSASAAFVRMQSWGSLLSIETAPRGGGHVKNTTTPLRAGKGKHLVGQSTMRLKAHGEHQAEGTRSRLGAACRSEGSSALMMSNAWRLMIIAWQFRRRRLLCLTLFTKPTLCQQMRDLIQKVAQAILCVTLGSSIAIDLH